MEIVSPTSDFEFNSISLADPQPLNGHAGFYFTQLSVGEDNRALCLQLPECITKQGIVNVKNAKYLDLMFERAIHTELMTWLERLEYRCQDIIDSKKDLWFQTELTRDDIETMMTQITRLYQSGKYVLMRTFVETAKTGSKCIVYDENEIGFDLDILTPNQPIISLVMFEGVKFSSRSFEVSLKLIQVMVIGKTEKKSSCLIKRQPQVLSEDNEIAHIETVAQAPLAPLAKAVQAVKAQVQMVAKSLTPLVKKTTFVMDGPKLESVGQIKLSANVSRPNVTPPNLEKNGLEEVTIDYNSINTEAIALKDPNVVYQEMYKKAREKAKQCRLKAVEAYLEAKQIKTKYMLFDIDDDSDDSDEENYLG